jgi:hypothetical protein
MYNFLRCKRAETSGQWVDDLTRESAKQHKKVVGRTPAIILDQNVFLFELRKSLK